MQITKETAAYLNQIVTFTGEVTKDGQPVRRESVPAKHQRTRNSLAVKLDGLLQMGLIDKSLTGERLLLSDPRIEWVKFVPDYKAPEDRLVVNATQFTDGEMELSDTEKEFVTYCLKGRDELPVVSDAALDEFDALTK